MYFIFWKDVFGCSFVLVMVVEDFVGVVFDFQDGVGCCFQVVVGKGCIGCSYIDYVDF